MLLMDEDNVKHQRLVILASVLYGWTLPRSLSTQVLRSCTEAFYRWSLSVVVSALTRRERYIDCGLKTKSGVKLIQATSVLKNLTS